MYKQRYQKKWLDVELNSTVIHDEWRGTPLEEWTKQIRKDMGRRGEADT